MKKLSFVIFMFFTVLIVTVLLRCKKDSETELKGAYMNMGYAGIYFLTTLEGFNSMTDLAFISNNLKTDTFGTCPIIIGSTAQNTLTYDWGLGCKSSDKITRKGKIIISFIPGQKATFTFVDFFMDGNKITGSHVIKCSGLSRYYVSTDAKVTFPDTTFMTISYSVYRFMIEGSSTTSLTDDVWRNYPETFSGKTRQGIFWGANCGKGFVKKNSCNWISSGILLFTSPFLNDCLADFGDGTCNGYVTLGEHNFPIEGIMTRISDISNY